LPAAAQGLKDMFFPSGGVEPQNHLIGSGLVMVLLLTSVIAGVIAITQAQRKIPVQYAQRAVGRKMYSGGTSFMPLKVNYAGVMPIIFAQSLLMFPTQIFKYASIYFEKTPFLSDTFREIATALDPQAGSIWYLAAYSLMILFFSYFWVATQFNELQIADDLKKNGGYIPGVRPGQGTSDYLHKAMTRITLAGAIFLTVIAIIPIILSRQMNIPYIVASFFGGTSILITVGVLLDTMRQIESHLMMRHYDGFLKKGRIRGRF
jgi:preprotein translocase subunit SecY